MQANADAAATATASTADRASAASSDSWLICDAADPRPPTASVSAPMPAPIADVESSAPRAQPLRADLQKLSAAALASMLASATVEAELAADRAVHAALIRARRHDADGFIQGTTRALQGTRGHYQGTPGYSRVLSEYSRVPQVLQRAQAGARIAGGRQTRAVRTGSRARRTRMTRCTTQRGASAARSWAGLARVRSHAHTLVPWPGEKCVTTATQERHAGRGCMRCVHA